MDKKKTPNRNSAVGKTLSRKLMIVLYKIFTEVFAENDSCF